MFYTILFLLFGVVISIQNIPLSPSIRGNTSPLSPEEEEQLNVIILDDDRYTDDFEYLDFGQTGVVYKTIRKHDNQPVILKYRRPELFIEHLKQNAIIQEYKNIRQIHNHQLTQKYQSYRTKYIPPVHLIKINDLYALEMPLYQSNISFNLDQWPSPPVNITTFNFLITFLTQLLEVFDLLQEVGIYYADSHLWNVLLDADRNLKLIDFDEVRNMSDLYGDYISGRSRHYLRSQYNDVGQSVLLLFGGGTADIAALEGIDEMYSRVYGEAWFVVRGLLRLLLREDLTDRDKRRLVEGLVGRLDFAWDACMECWQAPPAEEDHWWVWLLIALGCGLPPVGVCVLLFVSIGKLKED